jgi:CRP-like cAMP-binding protein
MEVFHLWLKKDEVLCREGDPKNDLYLIEEGELLVCIRKGTQVTPIAYLGKGEYIGELSFFDGLPRGADIVALKDTKLIMIEAEQLHKNFPSWIGTMGQVLSKKIRLMDDVIRQKGIKKTSATLKPLDIAEQTRLNKLLSK